MEIYIEVDYPRRYFTFTVEQLKEDNREDILAHPSKEGWHDVDAETLARWEKAEKAFGKYQQEIRELLKVKR